jgi:hypothetical protein
LSIPGLLVYVCQKAKVTDSDGRYISFYQRDNWAKHSKNYGIAITNSSQDERTSSWERCPQKKQNGLLLEDNGDGVMVESDSNGT